jgi:hypothetical protein
MNTSSSALLGAINRFFRSVSLEKFLGVINVGVIGAVCDCHHNQEIGHDDLPNPLAAIVAAVGDFAAALSRQLI